MNTNVQEITSRILEVVTSSLSQEDKLNALKNIITVDFGLSNDIYQQVLQLVNQNMPIPSLEEALNSIVSQAVNSNDFLEGASFLSDNIDLVSSIGDFLSQNFDQTEE